MSNWVEGLVIFDRLGSRGPVGHMCPTGQGLVYHSFVVVVKDLETASDFV